MIYGIANFKRELPNFNGFKLVASFDNYTIFSITDESVGNFPTNIEYEQITELEGTTAWKFYCEVRGYRSAYSDVEGLEPDPESLAQGKRKTKIYMTPEITEASLTLAKRILKRNIADVFSTREDQTGKDELLQFVDSLVNVKDLCYHKERLMGTELSKTQLKEMFLWDDLTDSRIGKHQFTLGF